MAVDDFSLRKDDNGREYVEFAEGLTKTRGGGLSKKCRDFSPKMFATGGERCPVSLFKEYLSRRPNHLRTTGSFYLSINYKPKDEVWYKAQPMGTNRINEMMKRIVAGTSLESSSKKLTNHSARKTLVNKLKKCNVERSSIVKVTGHRNLQSLDDYDEGDEVEQRDLSTKISCRSNSSNVQSVLTASNIVCQQQQSSASTSSTLSRPYGLNVSQQDTSQTNMAFNNSCFNSAMVRQESQHQMFNSNTFHNCQVSFTVMSKPSDDVQAQGQKRRRTFMIDSDSD